MSALERGSDAYASSGGTRASASSTDSPATVNRVSSSRAERRDGCIASWKAG